MPLVQLITIVLIFKTQMADSYSSGAPASTCSTLDPSPRHGPSTATGSSPYSLNVSATSYNPGDVIQVTLGGAAFKGFLIVARGSIGSSDPVGTFSVVNDSKDVCSGSMGSGLTHNSSAVKSSISFNWTAPSVTVGDVVFHYSVVRGGAPNTSRNLADYFEDLTSVNLTGPLSTFKKNPECGTTRGCLSNCVNNDCSWEVTWKNAGDRYQFTIKSVASDNTYLSLGFSNTSGMYPASVVTCILFNGQASVNASVNDNYSNRGLTNPKEGISNETNSYNRGLLECSFDRVTISNDTQVYNLTEPWYLIIAKGPVNAAGGLRKHSGTDRYQTNARVNLSNGTTDDTFGVVTTSAPGSTTPPSQITFKKNPECGTTRGCLSNCINNNCNWEVTWKNAGDRYQFTIKSVTLDNTYLSLGFSNTSGMYPASVVTCILFNGQASVNASVNENYSNRGLTNPKEGISNETNSYNGGLLECSFYRVTLSNDTKVYNLTEPWYLIIAKGGVTADGGLRKHSGTDRYQTNARVNLSNGTTDDTFGVVTTSAPGSTTPQSPVSKFQKDPECGKTKGCYSNCNNNLCDLLASWENKGSYFEITLKSGFATPGDNYFAFGLSETSTMGPASVVACTSYQGKEDAYSSYNDASHGNSPLQNSQEGLSNIKGSYSEGVLTCTLNRATSSNNPQFYDLQQQWYIVIARGGAGQGGGLREHTVADRSVWSSRVDFTDPTVDISMESDDYPLVKAHGCLMVITWVLAASIGLTMARFFKKLWPDNKIGGLKIWFAVHRGSMVVAFVLGITAFILIFIQVKGYSETTGPAYIKAHPVLGIMVTALLFINPFMSLLRCGPDHPRRELFNWAHWLVGTSAHVLGGITVVLGLYMPKALLDADKGLVIMIVYGSWYIIFFLVMTQLDLKSSGAPSKTLAPGGQPLELTDSIGKNANDTNGGNMEELTSVKYGLLNASNEPPLSGVKKLLTLFHFLMLSALTIALIYLIVNGSF